MRAFWLALFVFTGCVPVDESVDGRPATRSVAPALGAADSLDSADFDCQIVARQASRQAQAPAFVERCDAEGRCTWLWRVTADANGSALEDGFEPALLYRGMDGQWYSVAGEAAGRADAGYTRFGFDVWEHTVGPSSSSTTGLSRFELPMIPYLQHPDGRRVFDHNRVREPASSYTLSGQNAFSLLDDPRVCAAEPVDAVIQFGADWQTTVLGELRGGGTVALVYDENRLPQCRSTHNGNPAWSLEGYLKSDGEVQSASMIDFPRTFGSGADPVAARFRLAAHAENLEIWFKNAAYAGGFCETFDSDFGRNHRFDVTPLAAPDWVGNATVTISRSASTPCESGQSLEQDFHFDTWARQRAAIASVCTEIYAAGVSDRASAGDVFDAAVEVRAAGQDAWVSYPMELDGRVGNNLRYHASLRGIDPFPMYGDRCPSVPYETDDSYMWVDVELRFVVNGAVVGDQTYAGRFTQYLDDTCRVP